MILAHIMMIPVEEILAPLLSGVGTAAALWLAAVLAPLRTKLRQ